MRKKILITGGHATPAIALVNKIKKETNWKIAYLGDRYAFGNKKVASYEYETIRKMEGVEFVSLTTGKIPRQLSFRLFPWLAKIPLGFWQSFRLIKKTRPHLIVSFGGYLSSPAVISGWLLGIPAVTHEQTTVVGLANKINAVFAKRIAVTFPQTKKGLPSDKTTVTGNIVREEIFHPKETKRLSFLKKEKKPIIYITGGKTGSLSINSLAAPLLPRLTKQYLVVHQTGRLDYKKFAKMPGYFVSDFFSANEVGWILKYCRLVVSRAGANTICELILTKKAAVLIPLANTSRGEQQKNADFLASTGLAKILNQKTASPAKLLTAIKTVINHPQQYRLKNSKITGKLIDPGAEKLFRIIKKTIK